MIIAKSFARIHETNLKKQGIVPLTFANPSDYDRIPSDGCYVSTMGLRELLHNGHGELELLVQSLDRKTSFQIPVRHSMSADQLSWLRSGSALNAIRAVATS